MKILVTDGENRSALAVTRSLGKKGHTIIVTGAGDGNISGSSRYCRKKVCTPNPMKEGEKYSERLCEIISSEKIDFVFPMTEQSIYLLNQIRDKLPRGVVLACATAGTMAAVSNKYSLFIMARDAGVQIPGTIFIRGKRDFLINEPRITAYPVVVKPALSIIPNGDEIVSTRVSYAADRKELRRLYEVDPILRHPSLIQELIVGPGTGLFTLFDGDCHLALFAHRRVLEKPPSGGVSVVCESVPVDPEMANSAEKLLSAVGWKGVAMVEFKRDQRDGIAKLMEINGRFWGSLQLAIASGMNFPELCLDYYLGKKPGKVLSDFTIGQKVKWLLGIMDHIIIRLKEGHDGINVQQATPSYWKVAKALFSSGDASSSFDVYNSQDVKPFVTEIKAYIKNIFGR